MLHANLYVICSNTQKQQLLCTENTNLVGCIVVRLTALFCLDSAVFLMLNEQQFYLLVSIQVSRICVHQETFVLFRTGIKLALVVVVFWFSLTFTLLLSSFLPFDSFEKLAILSLLFLIFVFSIQLTVSKQMFNINFADDWIRTTDLYRRSHNHYPSLK